MLSACNVIRCGAQLKNPTALPDPDLLPIVSWIEQFFKVTINNYDATDISSLFN